MTGILVQLGLSWLIIRWYEKRNRDVLGLLPTGARARDFALFLAVTALCCASGFLFKMAFADQRWELNPSFSAGLVVSGLWWNVKSVLFEELIFRGVLFYILLKEIGAARAVLVSSAVFGAYHWFSQGLFGDIPMMAQAFLLSGTMGALLAYGFARTGSLYVPCAIHLGWNAAQSVLFSDGAIGDQLLVPVKPAPEVTVSYPEFFLILLFPVTSALLGNYLLLRARPPLDPPGAA